MSGHTKEPWKIVERVDGHGNIIGFSIWQDVSQRYLGEPSGGRIAYTDGTSEIKRTNFRRIVACVNACRSVSDENLADDCVEKMRDDRDKLLEKKAALYGMVDAANFKKNEYFARAEKAEAQRDELLAALKELTENEDHPCFASAIYSELPKGIDLKEWRDKVRALISRIEAAR